MARRTQGAARAVRIARAYEEPGAGDGYRVLVDRLWPRGVRKDALAIDAWTKEVAPSDELRRWFGHDPARWEEFVERYREELARPPAAELVGELVARAKRGPVTLVYGAKDEAHNQAVVLRDVIEEQAKRRRAPTSTAGRAGSRARGRARGRTGRSSSPASCGRTCRPRARTGADPTLQRSSARFDDGASHVTRPS
jgi:uncharacterized protein YeaO (DUF488 family)